MPKKKKVAPTSSRSVRTDVPASELKKGLHEYLERVSRVGEEVVITRYGKPIARLAPVETAHARPALFGYLAGSVRVLGDITVGVDEVWEADA